MARPVVEVFSVSIYPESLPCQVYGNIFVYDENDPDQTYKFYERDSEHPEVITEKGQVLLLTGTKVALSMPNPVINIKLEDPKMALIISSVEHLDNTTPDDYEQVKNLVIEGKHGYIRLNYIAMGCAVVAQVLMFLDERNPDVAKKLEELSISSHPEVGFPAFGTVTARYGKTYGHPTCDDVASYFNLLKILPNESIPITSNGPREATVLLCREFVAVPAYSSLIIEANIWDSDTDEQILRGTAKFRAAMICSFMCPEDETILYSDKVVIWLRWLDPSVDFESQYSSFVEDKLASMSLHSKRNLIGWSESWCLMEVHSVLIGREKDVDLSVSGSIFIVHNDNDDTTYIFNRDDDDADKLVNGRKLLTVKGPSNPDEFIRFYGFFTLVVEKLMDAYGRLYISDGCIQHNTCGWMKDELRYDKLLCTAIEGERGFCAVHYTNFSKAVGVQVKCAVLCKSVDIANVYGKIVASYEMFRYTFEYDRKYCRRVLFEKSEDNVDFLRKVISKKEAERFTDGHKLIEVEFSKSYVAMPIGYTLFLHVDLCASSHPGRGPVEQFNDTLPFKLGGSSPMKIEGEDYDILVYVEMISIPRQ